jgi:electron transfer flavoprotein beta subunit
MEISVCISRVPDTTSRPEVTDGTLDLSRVNYVMNPYDEYAVEEAVLTKERFAGSMVTVFTVGREDSRDILRKALAMGVDKAVLVHCEAVSDSWQIACALSEAIRGYYRENLPEIIFCGKESTDFQCGLVPAMIGGILGMASVSAVSALEVAKGTIFAEREIEGGKERLNAFFPVVLSAEKGLNNPRKTGIKSVIAAKKAVIEEVRIEVHEAPAVEYSDYERTVRKKTCIFFDDPRELAVILKKETGPAT